MKINIDQQIVTDNHIAYMTVGNYIVAWNRYFPSLLKFNKEDFPQILELIRNKELEPEFDEGFVDFLRQNNLLLTEDYAKKYHAQSLAFGDYCRMKMNETAQERKSFYSVQFYNEECNFDCPYCVMKHSWGKVDTKHREKVDQEKLYERMIKLLEFQYEAMKKENKEDFVLSLNGGEFLLHFDLLKRIVAYIRDERGDKKSRISLNSNGALINDEIAEYLVQNNIGVFISIDGNKSHHDSTRVYHNGKGSFEDVMEAVRILKKHNYQNDSMNYFQGTIQDFSKIDVNELLSLAEYGYQGARLSPNLMDSTPEDGIDKAEHFFNLVKKTANQDFKVYDTFFEGFRKSIESGVKSTFLPYCNGLGGRFNSAIMFNISNGSMSYLCQYAVPSNSKIEDELDPYSPDLIDKSVEYIKHRAASVIRNCKECPIVGICKGGCVMDGLTVENELNPTACNYQKTMWYLYIQDVYGEKKEVKE